MPAEVCCSLLSAERSRGEPSLSQETEGAGFPETEQLRFADVKAVVLEGSLVNCGAESCWAEEREKSSC